MSIAPEKLAELLYNTQFRFTSEVDLQDAVENLLRTSGISYVREYRLSAKERIDFYVDGCIGVEIKVASSVNTVQRQLKRYAVSEEVKALVLVTTKASHKGLSAVVTDKPTYVVHLLHSCF